MSVASLLSVVAALVAVVLILWTMPVGKRLAAKLGLPELRGPGAWFASRTARPSREDRDYLLRVCGGDAAEVERRLAVERARYSALSEADIYRRAIRTYMNGREDRA